MSHASYALAGPLQLASGLDILRLSLHVLAATIWVGGQFVLAGLLGTVRTMGEGAPKKIAQAFGRMSWPAYWLLIATGIWNYFAIDHQSASSSWNAAFGIKMLMVVLAGLGSYLHTKATTPRARGIYAGVASLASVAALVLGIAIAG
jgi:putative copper export protein